MNITNKKFLTVEDSNSIVSECGHGWTDYLVIPIDVTEGDVSFEFVDITITEDNGEYICKAVINSSLWTKGYAITFEQPYPPVYHCNGEIMGDFKGVIVETNTTEFNLILELSNDFQYIDSFIETDPNVYRIDFKVDIPSVAIPYYENAVVNGRVLDFNDEKKENIKVSKDDVTWTATDNDGAFSLDYGKAKPGIYKLDVLVNYLFDMAYMNHYPVLVNRLKADVPMDFNGFIVMRGNTMVITNSDYILKDSRQYLLFKFICNENITSSEVFENNKMYLIINNKKYSLKSYQDYTAKFLINLNDFHNNKLHCTLLIEGNDYINPAKYNFILNCQYANNDLMLPAIDSHSNIRTLEFNENFTISSSFPNFTFNSKELTIIGNGYTLKSNTTLKNINLKFKNVFKNVIFKDVHIKQQTGSEVIFEDCIFDNTNFMTVKEDNSNTFETTFKNCRFDNVKDTAIVSYGDLTVTGSVFNRDTLTDTTSDSVAFINVVEGKAKLDNNEFNIQGTSNELLLNCVMFRIGRTSLLNDKYGEDLQGNDSFPLLNNKGKVDLEIDSNNINGIVNWIISDTNTVNIRS